MIDNVRSQSIWKVRIGKNKPMKDDLSVVNAENICRERLGPDVITAYPITELFATLVSWLPVWD